MTKARDLANASTALSAVSATELGYVDGVMLYGRIDEDGLMRVTCTAENPDYQAWLNPEAALSTPIATE